MKPRFLPQATALVALSTFATAGTVTCELTGTVCTNSHSSGPFAAAMSGDTAVLRFDVTTPGMDVVAGQLTNYAIDLSSFDLDINGPTGVGLGGATNLQIQNDFPAADGWRITGASLTTGDAFGAGFGTVGSFFTSTDLDVLAGVYNVAANLTSFSYSIMGPTGFMEIFPETLVITGAPVFVDLCNGDGGNQMGCTNCPCGNNAMPGTIGGCTNSGGGSTAIAASGSTSVSLGAGDPTDLRLTLTGAPPNAFCVMLSGDAVAPANMANPCFGMNSGAQAADRDGLRCAVQNTLRHGGRSANVAGEVVDSAGPSRVWGGEAQPNAGIAGQAGFVAGQTRYFQLNHRDDAMQVCMRGLNTSQAIEVTFEP